MELLNFSIEHVPADVRAIGEKVTEWTEKIKTALQSGVAIDIAELVPEGEADREAIIALLTTVEKSCNAVMAFDWTGVVARLQRAVADITLLVHGGKHSISWYISHIELVIADFIAKA